METHQVSTRCCTSCAQQSIRLCRTPAFLFPNSLQNQRPAQELGFLHARPWHEVGGTRPSVIQIMLVRSFHARSSIMIPYILGQCTALSLTGRRRARTTQKRPSCLYINIVDMLRCCCAYVIISTSMRRVSTSSRYRLSRHDWAMDLWELLNHVLQKNTFDRSRTV